MSSPQIVYQVPLKSVGVTYLWWLILGAFGAHKFYLGRPGMGVLYAFTLGLLWIGLLYDLFTIPSQVRTANAKLMGQGHGMRTNFSDKASASPNYDAADAAIARYVQQTSVQKPVPAQTVSASAGFGRRGLST